MRTFLMYGVFRSFVLLGGTELLQKPNPKRPCAEHIVYTFALK